LEEFDVDREHRPEFREWTLLKIERV
jgi:hypothetical protein